MYGIRNRTTKKLKIETEVLELGAGIEIKFSVRLYSKKNATNNKTKNP